MEQSSSPPIKMEVPENPAGGSRWVIPDVHGCAQTLKFVVEEYICLQKNDQLFLLGDYIDRGPDNLGVLEFIFHLKSEGYQVHCLRGNHEEMFLRAWESGLIGLEVHMKEFNCSDLHPDKVGKARFREVISFFEELPYFIESGRFLLVHAGFNFRALKPFEDYRSMIWIRDWEPNLIALSGKRVIHGHTPVMRSEIEWKVKQKAKVLNLDNGCVFTQFGEQRGNLCAFEMNTEQLIVRRNAEDL